ncbi:MAG: hypothetical protein O7A63_08290 [Acidobacteria bacterium]|nr:hypothetical protein [Acidobacteriota bacterium]
MCVFAICFATQDSARTSDDENNRAIFSEEFGFVVNERIPLDVTIGRVHVAVITTEVRASGRDTYRLTFRLEAENPKGHDQTIAVRIEVLDERGDLIRSVETTKDIEEKESKKLKIVLHLDSPPLEIVESFHLEMQAWDD